VFRHTYVAYILFNGNVCNNKCSLDLAAQINKSRKRSSSGFGKGLAWRVWVVPWLMLLGGIGGVTGVSIPDCTPSHSNDRCGIRAAVDAYLECTGSNCGGNYGPIQAWDTSLVTDMSYLFRNKVAFNADIAAWDVSKVTDMESSKFNPSLFSFSTSFSLSASFSHSILSPFTFLVGSTIPVYSCSVFWGH
jgi:surface protein